MRDSELWLLEERFWTAGDEHHQEFPNPMCAALPEPVGVLSQEIIESLRDTPRWTSAP